MVELDCDVWLDGEQTCEVGPPLFEESCILCKINRRIRLGWRISCKLYMIKSQKRARRQFGAKIMYVLHDNRVKPALAPKIMYLLHDNQLEPTLARNIVYLLHDNQINSHLSLALPTCSLLPHPQLRRLTGFPATFPRPNPPACAHRPPPQAGWSRFP